MSARPDIKVDDGVGCLGWEVAKELDEADFSVDFDIGACRHDDDNGLGVFLPREVSMDNGVTYVYTDWGFRADH